MGLWVRWERARARSERETTGHERFDIHALGHIGGCDLEKGEIEF
jgi:hypothetical protein